MRWNTFMRFSLHFLKLARLMAALALPALSVELAVRDCHDDVARCHAPVPFGRTAPSSPRLSTPARGDQSLVQAQTVLSSPDQAHRCRSQKLRGTAASPLPTTSSHAHVGFAAR